MSSRDVLSGTILNNRYEVGELLGSGGFGATYRARDRARFDAPCVVKELLPGRRDNATARRLFEREARLLFALSHPQIPTLHAYFEEDERFYLVQDYVHGQTLKDRLARVTRVSEDETTRIVDSVLGVLEYLHGREPSVIHRDIKPANIILGDDGVVYLIDFGAVREVLGPDDNQTAIGTAGYTPREQAVGRPRPSSDLYALGATALEMVSGQHPIEWHDRSTGQLDWRGKVECSPRFERLLDGMLVEVPRRFPTSEAAREALHREFPNLASSATVPTPVAMTPIVLTPLSVTPISVTPVSGTSVTVPQSASELESQGASVTATARPPASPPPIIATSRTTDELATERPRDSVGGNGPWRFFFAGVSLLILLLLALKVFTGNEPSGPASETRASAPAPSAPDVPAPEVDVPGERDADRAPMGEARGTDDRLSGTRDPSVKPSAETPKGDNTATTSTRKSDSARGMPPRSDSTSVECARLLERVGLGEVLTAQESARMRRNCQGSPG